jgi:CotS family spore coat protein
MLRKEMNFFLSWRGGCKLKQINKKEWEITSSEAIVDYIIKKGFKNIVAFEKGVDGKPYVRLKDKTFALIEEAEGERLILGSTDNTVDFSRVLAGFHMAAEGFTQPPGIKIKAFWGRSIEHYRTMTNNLEKYSRMITLKGQNNKFEEATSADLEVLLKRARKSLEIFRSADYLRALEKSMVKKEICLNAISDNIAVKSKLGIIITNIFDLGHNMIEEDLGNLIKKGMEGSGNKSLYKEVVENYSKIKYLDESSDPIIKAIVSFPYDSIRIITRYMDKREDENILFGKYKKYHERENKCGDFLGGI